MQVQATYVEYVGGPWDGAQTEWLQIPPPRLSRMLKGREYFYCLFEIDGELVYFFEGFHGRTIIADLIEDEV